MVATCDFRGDTSAHEGPNIVLTCTPPDSLDTSQGASPSNDSQSFPESTTKIHSDNKNIRINKNPPHLEKEIWAKFDTEFMKLNQDSWDKLKSKTVEPELYIEELNNMLTGFLLSKDEFKYETKEYFKHSQTSTDNIDEIKEQKNILNKKAKQNDATEEDKIAAKESIRLYNYVLKLKKEKDQTKLAIEQQKAYHKDFWKTARDVTNGSFGKQSTGPTFDKPTADNYYKTKYEHKVPVNLEDLKWFPQVDAPSIEYNLKPYTPKDIKHALFKKCNNSAPGEDGIVYGYLKKMPFLHKVLATAFTFIRDNGEAPEQWGKSKIILIKKDENGPDEDPTNFRMISLTLNIGKLYHTLEAQRTINFMVANKYLDPVAQKAYIDGINGCVEHVTVVQEVIQHAKTNHRTAHITWFDLEDAFGSISHVLIPFVMNYYHIPTNIIKYISNLYTKLKGKVSTNNWESDVFNFLKGVFQGDPFSGVIFLIVFNPILEYIKLQKEKQGYELKAKETVKYVITTQFADDFNVISKNSTSHQELVSDVEKKLQSMGLVLKPLKCRSLSVRSGKVTKMTFNLKSSTGVSLPILSVLEKPMKFLGSEVTEDDSPHAMFVKIHSKLETKLDNINKSTLRGEYKANIYARYALPSIRYYMSVHHIHKTHQEQLDSLARKYLTIWFKIQKHGVSDVSIFHPYMLAMKAPSQLYKEAHVGVYTMIRMKGDELVNHALDSRLERESGWTRKSSTVCQADQIYQDKIENRNIVIPTLQSERNSAINKAKKEVNKSIKEETIAMWNKKVQKLTLQGDFAKLLIEEQENVTWKSIVNNVPKGVLSFALRASVSGLPTPDNLKRWGIRKLDKCVICGNFANLEHVLNWCSTALNQKRFTWRHDSVLSYMKSEMDKGKPDNITIYTDIPGHSINGGTIPADILTTLQRPDIVIIDRSKKQISLFELTVSFEKNADAANARKTLSYLDLTSDLTKRGWSAQCVPFEIGSRGHINNRNKTSISDIMKKHNIKVNKKILFQNVSKISLLCSFDFFSSPLPAVLAEPTISSALTPNCIAA